MSPVKSWPPATLVEASLMQTSLCDLFSLLVDVVDLTTASAVAEAGGETTRVELSGRAVSADRDDDGPGMSAVSGCW